MGPGQSTDNDALRLVIDSELDPRVFVSPIRDGTGALVDLRCEDVNLAALRELHADRDDLIGTHMLDLCPSFANGLFDVYVQAMETGESLAIDDIRVRHREQTAWIDLRTVRIGDGLSVTWRDVSDRHSRQAALAESEQWYRLLAENSSDVLVRADNQGTLGWVSDSARDRLGWEPDDLVGMPITELIQPDYLPALGEAQRALLDGEQQRVRLPIRQRDGQWRWFATLFEPLRDKNGVVVGWIASWRDVTDRTELSEQLARAEQRFRLIATSTSDIIAVGTTDRVLEWVTPSITTNLGWLPEQWVGHSPDEFFHPDDIAALKTAGGDLIEGKPSALRVRLLAADGAYHWAESHSAPLTDEEENIVGIMAIMTLIDDRVAWEETLQHRATHDPLTGLLTREEGYRRLATILDSDPATGVSTFLAFIDMDEMKEVNDSIGHAAGDELLRVTAQRIRNLLRDGDLGVRIGGDEMLLVLTDIRHTEAAVMLMTELLKAVNAPHQYGAGNTLRPRLSIGLTEITPDDDIEESVNRGDQAMYQAKAAGGNQIRITARADR